MSDESKKEWVHVWLENPPEPWRRMQDHIDEQKRSQRLYVVAIVTMIISGLVALGTAATGVAALRSQAAQTVRVECVAPPVPTPSVTPVPKP
jgi:hypothetical protein